MRLETVGDYFTALTGAAWEDTAILEWPPEAFCLAASLLQRTGGYIRVVQAWPPMITPTGRAQVSVWVAEMRRRGECWWEYANARLHGERMAIDAAIAQSWNVIIDSKQVLISELILAVSTEQYSE